MNSVHFHLLSDGNLFYQKYLILWEEKTIDTTNPKGPAQLCGLDLGMLWNWGTYFSFEGVKHFSCLLVIHHSALICHCDFSFIPQQAYIPHVTFW